MKNGFLAILFSLPGLAMSGPAAPRLGDGYPGRIEAYPSSPALERNLDAFSLKAGWFRRDDPPPDQYFNPVLCPVNELPFLLYRSPVRRRGLPLVVYFGGTGEQGTDLALQFRQSGVFRKVCSEAFQKAHPCHLFAPMLPAAGSLESGAPEAPTNLAQLVCDAMFAAIRSLGPGAVDPNRIYVTGLSSGGAASVSLMSAWPGRFAAAVPVATTAEAGMVPASRPGSYWILYNESEFRRPGARAALDAFRRTVEERGGEVRESTFPASGHNAWDAAWSENAVWDWLFSKTADGRPARPGAAAGPASVPMPSAAPRPRAECSASKPGRDAATGPERAVDGLDATAYVSSVPMGRDDWIEFSFEPAFRGTFVLRTGTEKGERRLSSGHAETSSDGRLWLRVASVSKRDGTCRASVTSPVRFLRLRPTPRTPEVVTVRELVLLP